MKEARQKQVLTVKYHLYKILENINWSDTITVDLGPRRKGKGNEENRTEGGTRKLLEWWIFCHLDSSDGFIGQNSSNVHFNMCNSLYINTTTVKLLKTKNKKLAKPLLTYPLLTNQCHWRRESPRNQQGDKISI